VINITLYRPDGTKLIYENINHVHDFVHKIYFVTEAGYSVDSTLPYTLCDTAGRKDEPQTVPTSGAANEQG
jgi:hypothetical protein